MDRGALFTGRDANYPPPCPHLSPRHSSSLSTPLPSQAQAHSSHALSLGILGLTAALEAPGQRPLAPHVAALRAAAGRDEIVEAAVAALPAAVRTR